MANAAPTSPTEIAENMSSPRSPEAPTEVPDEVMTKEPDEVPTKVPDEVPTKVPDEVPTMEPAAAPKVSRKAMALAAAHPKGKAKSKTKEEKAEGKKKKEKKAKKKKKAAKQKELLAVKEEPKSPSMTVKEDERGETSPENLALPNEIVTVEHEKVEKTSEKARQLRSEKAGKGRREAATG